MNESSNDTIQVYCGTCNARVNATVVGEHVKTEQVTPGLDPVDSQYYVTVYRFAVCNGCASPFLMEQGYIEVPGEFSAPQESRLLYPVQQDIPLKRVPESVKRAYDHAVRSYTAGLYEPCVIMCRKCLEALCHELGEAQGSLQRRLSALREKQVIDSRLVTWTDGLRMLGNDAAHDLNSAIEQADAQDSLEFIEAIIMHVFVLSAKFEEFQRRRTRSS